MFTTCREGTLPGTVTADIVETFRDIQLASTERLSQDLLELQKTMREANEIHREQLCILRQIVQSGSQGMSKIELDLVLDTQTPSNTQATSLHNQAQSMAGPSTGTQVASKEQALPSKARKCDKELGSPSDRRSISLTRINFDSPLKILPGRVLTWGIGESGHRQLLDYNFDNLSYFAAIPAIFSRASIFMLRRSLVVQLFAQPLFIAIVAFASFRFFKFNPDYNAEDSPPSKALKFCIDALQRLVPFVLGLFISLQLQRWWTIRSRYLHRIHVCSALLSMQLGMVLPDHLRRFVKRIQGYLLATHKMVYICARHHHTDLDYNIFVTGGMMTETELQHLRESTHHAPHALQGQIGAYDMSAATLPVIWSVQLIYRLFSHCKASPKIEFPANLLIQMLSQCTEIKRSIHDIDMILNSPLPFPYVHLVTLVVHALAVFTCFETGIFLAKFYNHNDRIPWVYVFLKCTGVMILNGLYLGLLSLVTVLTDPFTDDWVGFPFQNFQCRMQKSQIFSHDVYFDNAAIDEEISQELEQHEGMGNEEKPKTQYEGGTLDIDEIDADCSDDSGIGDVIM